MDSNEFTLKDVELILEKQKKYFNTQVTKDIEFRINQLKLLKNAIKKHEEEISDALYKDLGKHKSESYVSEIGLLYHSISYTIRNLKRWAKPKKKKTSLFLMPAKSYVISEPYGSVLIIAPYNYPFQLVMEPLIGALAAGNTAVIKPSEMSPNVSKVIKNIIDHTFKDEYVKCVEGGIDTNTALLNSKFDYIFFTGSVSVGKIVMQAAAKNLIPVTLELGGKSPVIVDKSANIKEAASRIIWGKTLNAGQTCIAPDYLVVHEDVKDELVHEMIASIKNLYGENIENSDSFGRIINNKHFTRIKTMIEKDKDGILFGGNTNEKTKYIEPTLIEVKSRNAATMSEEIFGPVLPIMTYKNLDDAISDIRNQPKPLALYIFTSNSKVEKKLLKELSSGGVSINDTISHFANHNIPFGGVGNAGLGNYHGKYSFITFSHEKGVLKKPKSINIKVAYPSYNDKKLNLIKKIIK